MTVAIPPGVHGSITVNGNGDLVVGVAGDTEPAVYELQSLTLNGSVSVDIVGPVSLMLTNGTALNGPLGSAGKSEWLEPQIASGGITINGNVEAPFDGRGSHSHGYKAIGRWFPERGVDWYRKTFDISAVVSRSSSTASTAIRPCG